jgi:hypothetical protein
VKQDDVWGYHATPLIMSQRVRENIMVERGSAEKVLLLFERFLVPQQLVIVVMPLKLANTAVPPPCLFFRIIGIIIEYSESCHCGWWPASRSRKISSAPNSNEISSKVPTIQVQVQESV